MKDYDAHMKAQGIHKLSFLSEFYYFFALTSMEDCDLSYVTEDFGPFETLCCRFHTQIYWWLVVSSEIVLLPQHPGLHNQNFKKSKITKGDQTCITSNIT